MNAVASTKLTRPTEEGAKAEAEATKKNDNAAESFIVNNYATHNNNG